MTNKECQIIAEAFGTPCDYSPMDEYMNEKGGEWCEKNCGRVGDEQCWRRYIKLKLEERQNDGKRLFDYKKSD